jgi:hypothetical protein
LYPPSLVDPGAEVGTPSGQEPDDLHVAVLGCRVHRGVTTNTADIDVRVGPQSRLNAIQTAERCPAFEFRSLDHPSASRGRTNHLPSQHQCQDNSGDHNKRDD